MAFPNAPAAFMASRGFRVVLDATDQTGHSQGAWAYTAP
jgi:hypothetical protein